MAAAEFEFLGFGVTEAVAFAIGTAIHPAIRPIVQDLINLTWEAHPVAPLDVATAAEIAAERRDMEDFARQEAAKHGIAGEKMDQVITAARQGPGLSVALEMWRRGLIDEADFDVQLEKMRLAQVFREPIKALKAALLSPADLAAARQRGFIDAARQHDESARQGINADRADLLFELSGLPPGVERAMVMWRRGIITEAEFRQTVVEGNEKLKYTDEEAALRWDIEPLATLVNLRLRGWIDDAEYHRRAEAHGFRAELADDLFHAVGRPITLHQAMLGLRRGGVYGAPLEATPQPFRDAVIRSDIRPEWANLLYAGRETYPSAFVVRRLVDSGAFTADEGADLLYKAGWNRELADKAAAGFAQGTGTTAKGLTATDLAAEYEGQFITRAQYVSGLKQLGYPDAQANAKADATDAKRARTSRNQALSTLRGAYVRHRLGRDQVVTELAALGLPTRVQNAYLGDWDKERAWTPDAMTPAQIKKAWKLTAMTRDEAVTRLEFKGYDAGDANIYLDE